MAFAGAGMAVSPSDFDYSPGETQVTAKQAVVRYRPGLTQAELESLELAITNWKRRASYYSFCEQKRAVPEFRKIVEFGGAAIPVIAADLNKQPSYLFLALEDITGEDPIYEGIRGDLPAMVGAWLQWLKFDSAQQN